ncbi:peptide chain release factor N(5)-glutamine methyltransferase [Fructilactobacillus carniphilus]|uniref:Release factor glutamine methyltransferase n=2 Tax=Fructilactobacillus carniphilus TaxID=2940297 RepID=A0ABY5BZL0_9LACO|nr:peptide chain release factor N(5)-glutamine methyltransferase [Fructilactobacillus carniphilus]USS91290.1 peptide chain release factor N(5)-glutamine methyltransferase [Fructilactobacillus carniphilus]
MPMLKPNATPFEALRWASLCFKEQDIDPSEARYLLMGQLGWNQTQLLSDYRTPLTSTQVTEFGKNVRRRAVGEPTQYILGRAPFYGLELRVTPAVLIPRPETEELVDLILQDHRETKLRVLDVGTGSGAIALALKQARPQWSITASDISPDALAVAEQNAEELGLAVNFVTSDLLEDLPQQQFDVIVSNPPYIADAEVNVMDQTVLDYEPRLALFAPHDGLALYERLAHSIAPYLTATGAVYLEIGYHQGSAVQFLWRQQFPTADIELRRDLAGHDRMVRIQLEKKGL